MEKNLVHLTEVNMELLFNVLANGTLRWQSCYPVYETGRLMKKAKDAWTDLYPDFKFTNLSEFKYISSPNVPFVVIQFRLNEDSLQGIRESMKESMKKDYLAQNGLYFLRLRDGYYIGETKDLSERLATHIKNREIDSITIATYKSEEDALNKDSVRDLESLLLQYAIETGMALGANLKNTKLEGRKLLNFIDKNISEKNAKYIWDKITYLNLRDILDEARSRLLASNSNSLEPVEKEIEIAKVPVKSRKGTTVRTGAAKRLQESGVTMRADIRARTEEYFKEDKFYELVPKRAVPSSGYLKNGLEIFTAEYAKKALLDYLWKGFRNSKTDAIWTNQERTNGYVTAVTLAFLGIETAGDALGCLENVSEEEANKLISEFVDKNYNHYFQKHGDTNKH